MISAGVVVKLFAVCSQ